jgi:DnaJ like chaperone protein
LEKFNIEIRFKIVVLVTGIGFIIGMIFAKPAENDKEIDLGLAVELAFIFAIIGFSILPRIIFELANSYWKLYLISGPLGVAFIKLAFKIFVANGKLSKKAIASIIVYMQTEYGDLIVVPLDDYLHEITKIPESIVLITKPFTDTRISERIDILYRLFLLANADRIFNEKEENVLKVIAKALRIGRKRFEMVKNTVLIEKGYKSKEDDKKEQQNHSRNFYVMNQLLKMAYNPYIVLELDQNVSTEDLKKAYRRMVKKYHPDKSMLKDEQTRQHDAFKIIEINEAYESIKKMRGIK